MSRRNLWIIVAVLLLPLVLYGCTGELSSLTGTREVNGLGALSSSPSNGAIRIGVMTNVPLTAEILDQLAQYGTITQVLDEIDAVGMLATRDNLAKIAALDFVTYAAEDVQRVPLDYSEGISTWDLDIINVTDTASEARTVTYNGDGVYVAVIDTGLVFNWRDYLPEGQIATQYAKAFAGAGNERGGVSEPASQWEHDTISHGTHVTSTILGYSIYGFYTVNGVAPKAKIIPIKVINNGGFGWGLDIAAAILYVAGLELRPMVINMSIGGPAPDPIEEAAIDDAIAQGVIVVAAAGNSGDAGMDWPGAYPEVISAGAAGWTGEWTASAWWRALDVPEPTSADEVYITDFSSCEKTGQQLDVVAPGSWIVGPYLAYGAAHPPYWAPGVPGQYYYLGGTSMASPHVAGTAALMLEACPHLNQSQVEFRLKSTALPIPAGSAPVIDPFTGHYETITWGSDATGSGLIQADSALALPCP